MNYYQLLGININATHEEITRAYRKEIFKNHPDRNPGKENEKLQISILLNEAYEVLSNNEKKIEYDKNISKVELKIELKINLQKKNEKYLKYLKKRIKEHALEFENNYFSDLYYKHKYKITYSSEIKQIIEEQIKIDRNNRLIDLCIVNTRDYESIFFSPLNIYKRKYCIAMDFFESKLLYVLMIEKDEYDLLFKKRKINYAVLYFDGENIKFMDNILDKYIKCIIHYN